MPDIYAFGPNGFQSPLKVAKIAAGHYRARVAIGERQGLFRVRPLAESRAFPEVGFYRQEDEMLEYGANEQLLHQVADATGGRYNPALNADLRFRRPGDSGHAGPVAVPAGAGRGAESGGTGSCASGAGCGKACSVGGAPPRLLYRQTDRRAVRARRSPGKRRSDNQKL